ncbi:MAG: chromosome segregation protein SMC [Pygmaiobacter massiliensis]|nr:chromosome segregation protein SMC [Pygmaiobacter massiliensis]
MFLKALEIQGFKSFPDRTKITFEGGITAVVGPNGSGKSNISDAIRWVLGETSSKQLRGSGKMEDVIFGGTQKRSAMGFAAVSLYIDNSSHRLDMESEEVVITRRYYRSGESEYCINGQNVRLKDIYELFLDTGIGRDGYSIIGQGKIAEIVGAKSGERREIFEEASGIAKYRYRKNEAERRLAATQENLVRLEDILKELADRVGPLERESKKAQQFLEFSNTKRQLEVTLWTDMLRRAKDSLRQAARDAETAQADYDRCTGEIEKLDADTADTREMIARLNVQIERANAEIRSLTEQIAEQDSAAAVLENDVEHNRASIRDLQHQIEQAGRSDEQTAEQIQLQQAAEQAARKKEQDLSSEIDRISGMLEELGRQDRATGERRGVVLARISELSGFLTDLKVSTAAAQQACENAHARQQVIEQDDSAAKAQRLAAECKDTQTLLASLEEELVRLNNIKEGLSLKLSSRQKQLEEARQAVEQAQRQENSASQRIKILRDLENSMDGYSQSVKYVMRAAASHRLRGIVGPVSTILSVLPGCETAIETALGAAAQNIVVADENAAKAAIGLLKQDKAGRATFLPLTTVRPSFFERSKLPQGARLACDLVQADERYANVVSNLLGRIVVVEDLNAAGSAAKALDYRNRVVTMDGQVVNAGGSFTGGSVARSAGLFTRRSEIEELKGQLEKLSQTRTERTAAMEKIKAECEKLSAQLSATESEQITASGEQIRTRTELANLQTTQSQLASAAQLLQAEKQSLDETIAQAQNTLQQNRQRSEQLSAEQEALQKELAGITNQDDSALATRNRLAEELSQAKLARLAAQKDAELACQQTNSLLAASKDAQGRTRQLQENIAQLEEMIKERQQRMQTLKQQKQEKNDQIAKQEQMIRQAVDVRMEREASITEQTTQVRQLQTQRETLSQEIARQAERKAQLETEYDATTQKLWEEYEMTPNDAAELAVPFESAAQLRRQVAEVRGKIRALGNVNVGAIEEFAEVNERYQFMKSQVEDIEKSRRQLEKLIGGLCSEMRSLFTESFARINENFGRIFAELFGGGTATLSLADPEDVLESGIDITVAPPGKIIKNLSALSGGEQALVAISIYFAILAVNPAPFCILDEIEAALDDVNVVRFAGYLRRITDDTQFIVITHRRGTMEEADILYGVTMQEDGVSKLLRLKVDEVDVQLVQ